jgi:hypothetical protein
LQQLGVGKSSLWQQRGGDRDTGDRKPAPQAQE